MTADNETAAVGTATPEFANALLTDLYVRLRRDLQRWAMVTHQTPQARMGYVGQHLVSVVTGYPGGRSGARGDDLKLPNGRVGEIKCCYRVDQLGQCAACGAPVASIEHKCPRSACQSDNISRKDDSKWLLGPKTETELRELFVPERYYFVLFEFEDIAEATDINVCIYEVDPKCLGFALAMIDYFFNIRAHSSSGAPFNLWPNSPKFLMMKPKLIYWSVIATDDSIDTRIFPNVDPPRLVALGDLTQYAKASTFPESAIDRVAAMRGMSLTAATGIRAAVKRRSAKLEILQTHRENGAWPSDEELADDFAKAVFADRLATAADWTREFAPSL